MCAVLGQFSRLLYGLLKFKAVFVAKMVHDLSPNLLHAHLILKLLAQSLPE